MTKRINHKIDNQQHKIHFHLTQHNKTIQNKKLLKNNAHSIGHSNDP